MRLSAQIRKMLQSHPTHSQMQMWIKEAEKLEKRVEAARRHVEALQQRELFEVRDGGADGEQSKADSKSPWSDQ